MGLYASFSVEEAGFPEVVSKYVLDAYFEVEVDYSEACDAFVDTFISSATGLVPVDTGYLQSTIDADTDGAECFCEASAEYAQYVEYGTWCMDAQPYFEPALANAMGAFNGLARQAHREAKAELEMEVQAYLEEVAEAEQARGGGPGIGFGNMSLGGMLMGIGLLFLLFPVILNLYAVYRTLTDPFTGRGDASSGAGGSGGGGYMPEVIIT